MLHYAQQANPADKVSREVEEVLAQGHTAFQDYLFFRSRAHGVCIALDGDIQSCAADEALYHEALVHPAMLSHESPRTVLIMGGGEGATAREVLRHNCVRKVVMVDIDREFVDLCKRWIPDWGKTAFADPRLEVRYEDIRAYLNDTEEQFDVVIGDLVDVQDWDSGAAELYGANLYQSLKARMTPDAVLATQAGALSPLFPEGHNRIRSTLAGQFGHIQSYGVVVPSFYHLWGYVVASDAWLPEPGRAVADRFQERNEQRNLTLPATGAVALGAAFCLPRCITKGLQQQD